MTCLGVLERGERGDDNGTGLKEGGVIEMSIYSASITRCTLLRLIYLPANPANECNICEEMTKLG